MSSQGNKPIQSKGKAPAKPAMPPPKRGAQGGVRPAPKQKPTLPQHRFPSPYDRLLTLGERENVTPIYKEIAGQLKAGDPGQVRIAVQQLITMALDETYYTYQDADHWNAQETRDWTRTHAVGVLTHMGEPATAGIEPLLVLLDEEDDDLREEMPIFYGTLGEPAIEPLCRLLFDTDESPDLRCGVCDCLAQIGEFHPELRERVIPLLEQTIFQAGDDGDLVAYAICGLVDLKARESLPVIERAYEDGIVEDFIISMHDVEEAFDLPHKRPVPDPIVEDINESIINVPDELPGELPGNETAIASEAAQPFVKSIKLGRNEPCWCGSGKKFKACHGG